MNMILETRYQINSDELKNVHTTFIWVQNIETMIETNEKRLKDQRSDFETKLNKKRNELFTNLDEVSAELEKFKEMSDERPGQVSNAEIIQQLNEKLKNSRIEVEDLNEKEALMGFPITDFPKLPVCEEAIKPFEQLWILFKQQGRSLQGWRNNVIFELNQEEVEREAKEMGRLATNLKAKFEKMFPKPASLASILANRISEFQKSFPIINCFCNPGVKERHWKKISDIVGQTINNKDFKKSLYFLIQNLDIMKFRNQLDDISDQASQEYNNEKILNSMADQWKNVEFDTKVWRSTGTSIITGASVDEAQTLLDEHLVKTQTMKGHPFAKVFEVRILEWEKWLLTAISIVDIWMKVQSVWLYLEPVFTSEDIIHQLPNEGNLFREVDKAWRSMMEKVNIDKKVISVSKISNLKEDLDECNSKLESISKRLKQYLESKRLKFPRFFFLSDEELLEILSETKEPTRVQKHLCKCFEGINSLEFDSEKKIHAMMSKENEKINFLNIVDPVLARGCVELWLLLVEEDMIISLKNVTKQSLDDSKVTERKLWVGSWPGQCILCCSMTNWTFESENSMKKGGAKGLEEFLFKQKENVNVN